MSIREVLSQKKFRQPLFKQLNVSPPYIQDVRRTYVKQIRRLLGE